MKNLFAYLLEALLGGFILFWGCSSNPESSGNLDEIIVFADSSDWKDCRVPLDSVFGREYPTPIMEAEYILSWQPVRKINGFKHAKNIFFLGSLNSKGAVSTLVKNTLSQEIIDNVNSGKVFYIPRHDPWASNQYVLFLLAPTKSELIARIQKYGDVIYEDFEKSYYKRYKDEIYRSYENKDLEKYLIAHFPFRVRIPSDYFIASESLENNYVWIRRIDPDRSLMVHWVPIADSIQVNYQWVIRERNRIAAMIYEGDVVVEDETRSQTVKFNRWQALRLEGTWKNPKYFVGGPFRDITFVDKESGLIFMIDFYVKAVGERKKMFLDQLDIMAHTFQTKAHLNSGKSNSN